VFVVWLAIWVSDTIIKRNGASMKPSKGIDMPKFIPSQFKQAEKVKKSQGKQDELF
jgi:hypothetical protein